MILRQLVRIPLTHLESNSPPPYQLLISNSRLPGHIDLSNSVPGSCPQGCYIFDRYIIMNNLTYFCHCFFGFVFLAHTCGQSFRSTYRRSQTARKIFLQESNPWKMWEGLIELIKLTYSCVVETLWFSLTEHQVESLVILMGLAPLFVRRWCS